MSEAGISTAVALRGRRRLSSAQRSLWVSQLAHPTEPVQNMALVSHLEGPVDVDRFVASFNAVVGHYDVLRTTLPEGDDAVVLAPAGGLPTTEVIDLARHQVEKWATDRAAKPLDMRRCGFDSVLIRHDDGTSSWYLCLHHVLTDATSSSLVFAATGEVYAGRPLAPARSYYDWSAENEALPNGDNSHSPRSSAAQARARQYWAERPAAPRLGRLYRSTDRSSARAARVPLHPGDELLLKTRARLAGDLRMLTDHLGWTTLLTTATALYLHRVTGAEQFSVGLPVHNRTSPEQRDMVGPLMEVFPVDIQIQPDDTGRSLHKRVGRSVMTTLRHALAGTAPSADYESVVNVIPQVRQDRFGAFPATTRWIHPGSIDGSHLLRVQMTSYEAAASGAAPIANAGSPGSAPETSLDPSNTLEMPTINLQRYHDSLWEFALDLAEDACGDDQRQWAPGHLLTTLDALVTDPDQPLTEWGLVGHAELEALHRWGTGAAPRRDPSHGPVEELRSAILANSEVVLEHGPRSFTGPELWAWVEATATWMRRRGIEPGDRVGVDLARSAEAVVAILATLAVGASFVPLDPSQPLQRRQRLLQRAGCRLVVDDPMTVEACQPSPENDSAPFILGPDDPTAEAYVIFTSGSTGEPKGVPITRGGLVRYLDFACDRYTGGRRPRLVAPLFSPLTFDLTITTLFVPFLAGGRVVVIEADGPRGLSEIARRTDITWCKATPSHLEILVRLLPVDHRLSTIVVGGEAFASRLAADLLAGNSEREIHNEYGPTEAVVGCMDYLVEPSVLASQADVPIGKPAPGVDLAVVDRYLQPVPLGSPGELLISSPGLTAGYLRDIEPKSDPEADATADSPFLERDGRRWYRSGDLVRLQDTDRLVYLGRRDEQVKVGGIRLEPTEVEAALAQHPSVDQAVVRVWSPSTDGPDRHCVRCGLPDNIPGVAFDDQAVCDTCHAYDRVAPVAGSWFRTPDQLIEVRDRARSRRTGDYDCLHLLSGGKDSTYALYQLVEQGFRPYSITLDNGFISEEAKANVARSVADLGIDHEFVTVEAMNDIFRDSLERHSNVCHGCYKTIYTVAVNKATELGIPLIVTGLSRGQLFETRLIPQQFAADRFDPDAIDRAVAEARRIYHRANDAANRLLDTSVFDDDEVFERIEYLDFYRYVDVELSEMLRFLDQRAPWVRPKDTGRSTNCLINAAGIHTHQSEQGFHNYAVPYAWDVRLGHKTRDEAIEELDDRLDLTEVNAMLDEVGYTPRPRRFLTAWLLRADGQSIPGPSELRTFLSESLPAYAIPSAFVTIDDLPLSTNGKLDVASLPAPSRVHRSSATMTVPAATATEAAIIELWERTLGVEPIGVEDDFFALGGDSLAALQMTVGLGDRLGLRLSDDLAFVHTTPRSLGQAVDHLTGEHADMRRPIAEEQPAEPSRFATAAGAEPERSDGELAVLFDQAQRPDDVMYNVARVYRVAGSFDHTAFERALREVAALHQPLSWTFASPRQRLSSEQAVSCEVRHEVIDDEAFAQLIRQVHLKPFDPLQGPLLRVVIQPLEGATTAVLLVIHHASGDAASFDRLWEQIDRRLSGEELPTFDVDYAGFGAWQRDRYQGPDGDRAKAHWLALADTDRRLASLAIHPPSPGPDGFATRTAAISPDRLRAVTRNSTAASVVGLLAGVLGRYHDGDDLELGLITSTRDHRAAEALFGYFLNTVPVRLPAGPESATDGASNPYTAIGLADAAAAAIGRALAFRSYPRAQLAADRRAAGLGDVELDVLVSYDELPALRFQGAPVHQKVLWNGSAVAPLTFFAEARPDGIDLSVEFQGDRIPESVAHQMLAAWEAALVAAASQPTGRVDQMIDRFLDQHDQLSTLSNPPPAFDRPIIERIEAGFHRADAASLAAVECGDRSLTWSQLQQRSNDLAGALLDRGVAPGDRIAVLLGRQVELVVALVAIGRLGASYVPIDPTHPAERQTQAVELAQASALIAPPGAAQDGTGAQLLSIDADTVDGRPWGSDPTAAEQVERARASADDELSLGREAYLIFTSGSTGTPRGVPVSIGHLTTSIAARSEVYPDSPDRFLMPSSPAFDSSIVGLYWTLAEGGTVVLPTERSVHDLDALLQLLANVDHALMVPTLYRALLDRSQRTGVGDQRSPWPRQIIVAGEACPASLVGDHFTHRLDARLTNEYGPTEATVWATAHHCRPGDDPVPLGPPIPGATVTIVDRFDRVRPTGVEGALLVGGDGVVEGYLDNPEATARAFDSLDLVGRGSSGVFRTGDQAVIVGGSGDSGAAQLLFLGRVDNRLNVGGVRVEPEEIEQALCTVGSVSAAVVTAVDVRDRDQLLTDLSPHAVASAFQRAAVAADPAGALDQELRREGRSDVRLIAHVETSGATDADLREAAKSLLPPALRPGRYVLHERLPRTPNGKIDRAAANELPLPDDRHRISTTEAGSEISTSTNDTPSAADGQLVAVLQRAFGDVLRSGPLAPDDSFFDRGGHSLLAMELVLAIEERTGLQFGPGLLYDHPTPRGLAGALDAPPSLPGGPRGLLIPIQPKGSKPPIFAVHVLGVDSAYFRPLAAELGDDQPMYGLGQPLIDSDLDTSTPTAVREVALGYAAEIDRVAPEGPIALAAISLGSVVAWELALELRRRNRQIEVLALFDALGPANILTDLDPRGRLSAHWTRASADPTRYAREQASRQGQKARRAAERAALSAQRRLGLRPSHRLEVRQFIEDNVRSQANYDFEPYDGRVLLIKAAEDPLAEQHLATNLGWNGLVTGPIDVALAPGGHLTMMEPPHVSVVSSRLADSLEASAQAGASSSQSIEAELVEALHRGELPVALARFADRKDLDHDSQVLVSRLDQLTADLADGSRRASDRASAVLRATGIDATPAPLPSRMTHPLAIIDIADRPAQALLDQAVAALNELGYRPVMMADDRQRLAIVETSGRLEFVGESDSSGRVQMRWPDIDAGSGSGRGRGEQDLGILLRTPDGLIAPLLQAAELEAGQLLVDLGCGDGRVLIEAAQRLGARAVGYESDPDLVVAGRKRIAAAGLAESVNIIHRDAREADLAEADVVFAFLPPEAVNELLDPALQKMKPGARFLCHEQLSATNDPPPHHTELVLSEKGAEPQAAGVTIAKLWVVEAP